MFKFTKVFMIRIVYKNGYFHDFEATEFTIKHGNYSWVAYSDSNKPLMLGADDISAIYQVGYRTKWF